MKLLNNIFFAATGQVTRIELIPMRFVPWLALTLCSIYATFTLSLNLWSIGVLQIIALSFIMLRMAQRQFFNISKAFFFALFGPSVIVALILLRAPGVVILPLYVLYCSKIWDTMSPLTPKQLRSKTVMTEEHAQEADSEAAQLRKLRATSRPGTKLVEAGPVIGHFLGCDIVEFFLDEQGRKFCFVGTLQDDESDVINAADSFVTPPGLIYKLAS